MTFAEYQEYFQSILNQAEHKAPYDNLDYLNYTKLNWSRMNRWLKHGLLSEAIQLKIKAINAPQQWIVITEPWCGDAAHIVPFLEMLAQLNPLISATYELRDSAPFRIEHYLSKGSKSIPKLIVRDAQENDLFTWGPRPAECQKVYDELKAQNADFETLKTELQHWYNGNNGVAIQQELLVLVSN